MTLRGVTLGTVLAVAVASCSGGDDPEAASTTIAEPTSTTTTAPERQASTTTTAFDPATVEGEVEAAYLRSWDVYADAVYDLELDEAALAEVYADDAPEHLHRRDRATASQTTALRYVQVDHDYEIDGCWTRPLPRDRHRIRNHQVLIDPSLRRSQLRTTRTSSCSCNFQMTLIEGVWKVTLIQRGRRHEALLAVAPRGSSWLLQATSQTRTRDAMSPNERPRPWRGLFG